MCGTLNVLLDDNEHVDFELTCTINRGKTQKSYVLPIVQAHEHLVFARIPYQKAHKNNASAEGANEEKLAIF